MEKFTVLTGLAAPLMRANIDTDAIIRSPWSRDSNLAKRLFASWRYDQAGDENHDFVLNQPRFRESRILVAGVNFGCGSSREGAVWALMSFGIRCVIAPSFGDIFFENSFQNGLLPISLPLEACTALASELLASDRPTLAVDLLQCLITRPNKDTIAFDIAPERRLALIEGLDELALLHQFDPDIREFQQRDVRDRPWIYKQ